MEKRMILAGKFKPGISKRENIKEIIEKINKLKISKEEREILFLTAMILLAPKKETTELVNQLKRFKKEGTIYPDFSSSKYISKIINNVKQLEPEQFESKVEGLIEYIEINNVKL